MSKRFVVVTTDYNRRGVFAGTLVKHEPDNEHGDRVVLKDARQCVYWPVGTRGVVGLASIGPKEGARVGPAAPRLELNGVTCVMDASPEAQELWEGAPWSS